MTPDAEQGKKEGAEAPPAPKKKAAKKPKAEPKVEEPKAAVKEVKVDEAPKAPPVVKKRTASKARDIGVDVTPPTKTCNDPCCPFHGKISVRGMILVGTVVTDKMDKSAVVLHNKMRYLPKFERYEKKTSKYTAHNPPCIAAKKGDQVTIMECRPISKTKAFIIIEKKGGSVNEGGSS